MATTTKTTAKTADKAEPQAFPDHPSLPHALVAFQGEMPKVHKGKTARIPGRDGKSGYSYQYADLADVTAAATPILVKHGLAFICLPQRTEQGAYELQARLLHTTGEFLEAALPLQGRAAQDLGSSITYGRRYLFGCLTGVVTDEDEDGDIATHTQAPQAQQGPPPQEQPMATPPWIQAVRDAIDTLDQDQVLALRDWWPSAGLPALDSINGVQADQVLAKVREMREEAANPQ